MGVDMSGQRDACVIYRFELRIVDEQQIRMPTGAQVLSADINPGDSGISVWALCNPEAANELRQFRVVGTGNHITASLSGYDFLSTVIHRIGSNVLCWHVFTKATNAT
jgi:hypothetical protein